MDFVTTYDSDAKVWESSKRMQLFNEQMSVGSIALYMLRSKPSDAVCQISDSEGTTLTYGTVCSYAIRVAQQLRALSLTADDVVGIMANNSTLLSPVIAGCWMNATPFHTVNPVHEEEVIRHLFAITKPKLIFCDGSCYEKLKRATSDLKPTIYTLCNHIEGVPEVNELLAPTEMELFYQAEPLKYGPSQTMAIMCSSGTTGKPKAVRVANSRLNLDLVFLTGATVMFSFSTPDWGSGLMMLCSTLLKGGKRIITTRPFTPEYLLQLIAKYEVNFLLTCPVHLSQSIMSPHCTTESLRSLRFVFMTGGQCSAATQARIRAQLDDTAMLLNAYGTSEIGGIAANFQDYKTNSLGRLVPNVRLKIVDVASGACVGPHQLGEIWVRPRDGWPGYYGNAAATSQCQDADGWICSGDIGYIDDEYYLHLVDRSKDIMKYNGMQYSPTEIEDTITALPDVLDVCVFGVYEEQRGDLAAAAVVLKPGSKLSEADVMQYVAKQQEVEFKQLHYGVFFVDAVARNANGKVLRHKVKELCLEMERTKAVKSKM